jgi:hypothetical protein
MTERQEGAENYPRRSFGDFAARIVELAVGYLTVVAILVYPIGLIALALQIWNAYAYGLFDALFVVSFAPVTLAAGKIFDFFMWSIIAVGSVGEIGLYIVMRREGGFLRIPDQALRSMTEERRTQWRSSEERFEKYLRRSLLLSAVLSLSAPFVLALIPFQSWRTWVLYIAFVVLCFAGGVAGGFLTTQHFREENSGSLWRANGVSYAFAILAGISLTGTVSPALPLVELDSSTLEAHLLGRTEGYWYVFDGQGTLVAVPNNEAGSIRFLTH